MARKANQVGSKIIIANSRQRKDILFQDSVRAQGPLFIWLYLSLHIEEMLRLPTEVATDKWLGTRLLQRSQKWTKTWVKNWCEQRTKTKLTASLREISEKANFWNEIRREVLSLFLEGIGSFVLPLVVERRVASLAPRAGHTQVTSLEPKCTKNVIINKQINW